MHGQWTDVATRTSATQASSQAALDVRGVSKAFKAARRSSRRTSPNDADRRTGRWTRRSWHTALRAVSMRIEPGEIYGVIGSNGSGKSTLIRILSTLLLPDAGEVHAFGRDVVHEPAAVRPLINRVSADPSFFRAMTPIENLSFYGQAYGIGRAEVRHRSSEILSRLHLEPERARTPMQHLSRGQQQKVAVARAFLTAPRLLLLDEPTTGLDLRSKRDVQRFVSEVRLDQGVTVLLTTHDMDEAELLCDRIAFLAGGEVVAEGTPAELKEQVARSRHVAEVDMETVFMDLTGRNIEEDEEEDEAAAGEEDLEAGHGH